MFDALTHPYIGLQLPPEKVGQGWVPESVRSEFTNTIPERCWSCVSYSGPSTSHAFLHFPHPLPIMLFFFPGVPESNSSCEPVQQMASVSAPFISLHLRLSTQNRSCQQIFLRPLKRMPSPHALDLWTVEKVMHRSTWGSGCVFTPSNGLAGWQSLAWKEFLAKLMVLAHLPAHLPVGVSPLLFQIASQDMHPLFRSRYVGMYRTSPNLS